jgi:hypothetical protein
MNMYSVKKIPKTSGPSKLVSNVMHPEHLLLTSRAIAIKMMVRFTGAEPPCLLRPQYADWLGTLRHSY